MASARLVPGETLSCLIQRNPRCIPRKLCPKQPPRAELLPGKSIFMRLCPLLTAGLGAGRDGEPSVHQDLNLHSTCQKVSKCWLILGSSLVLSFPVEKSLAFIPALPGTDFEISDHFMGRNGHLYPSCGYTG